MSIITAVFNRNSVVARSVESLQAQTYSDLEHLIIDGGSDDGTLEILAKMADERTHITSQPDEGIYDALNKGIGLATGEVIGLLHSDDVFASPTVLERVAREFEDSDVDAVYGDLQYVSAQDTTSVVRHWRAGRFSMDSLSRGWMPPHTTLFLRREVFERLGKYDTSYTIAADYNAILRWFGRGAIRSSYIPEVLVLMHLGGKSNGSLNQIVRKSKEDYRALRESRIGGIGTLALKNLRKLEQFL